MFVNCHPLVFIKFPSCNYKADFIELPTYPTDLPHLFISPRGLSDTVSACGVQSINSLLPLPLRNSQLSGLSLFKVPSGNVLDFQFIHSKNT